MTTHSSQSRTLPTILLMLSTAAIGAAGLAATSRHSYFLFHTATEFATAFICFLIFVVAWNARQVIDNRYILLVGISSLASGLLVFAHTMTYEGMTGFTGPDIDMAMEFWTTSRYVTALTLLTGPFLLKRRLRPGLVLAGYGGVTLALAALIITDRFPECYRAETGMTAFKIASDYIISFLLLAAAIVLTRKRSAFDRSVFILLVTAIGCLFLSSFLSYTGAHVIVERTNLAGHLFELLAFYLLYRAIVVTGITMPSRILFRELKLSEERMRESEARYRTLVEFSPDAIVVHCGGTFVYVNPAAVKLFGAESSDQLVGHAVLDRVHPEHREQAQLSPGGNNQGLPQEILLLRLDGRPIFVETVSAPTTHACKPATQVVIRDMTEKKRIEREMQHLASFPRLNPSPIIELDTDGTVRFANQATEAILNEMGLSLNATAFLPPDLPGLLKRMGPDNPPATLYREVSIRERTYGENIYLSPELGVARIYATDITQRKRMEEELRASEELLRAIIESTPDMVFVKDRDSRLLLANPAMFNVIGVAAGKAIGRTDRELYADPAAAQAVMENDRRVMASGKSEAFEERIPTPQGYRTFLTTKAPYRDGQGRAIGIIGIARDITDRVVMMKNLKTAVADAERSRSQMEAIFAAQADAVIMYDRDMNARQASRAFQETYGFDPVGLNVREIASRVAARSLDPRPLVWDEQPTPRALRGEIVRGVRYLVNRTDGTSGIVETSAGPLREGDVITGCVTVWHDVSEQVKAENELKMTKEELEQRVLVRTAQLVETVDTLHGEIEARTRMERELLTTKERLQNTLESIRDAFFVLDGEWKFTYVNGEAERLFKRERQRLLGSSYWEVVPEARGSVFEHEYLKVIEEQKPSAFEALSPLLGRWTAVRAYPLDHGISVYVQDISERKQAEQEVRVTNDLLKLFASTFSLKEYLDAAVEQIRVWSGCRNVGVRVADGSGRIPYMASTGFTAECLRSESMLDLHSDQCACTRVISGLLEPQDRGALSPKGSFYSNNTVRFMEDLTKQEKTRYRGVCMASGLLSLAVVPVRYREQTVGAIHLADERENMVPLQSVELVERMAPIIGEAVFRFGIEEELRANYNALRESERRYRALIEGARDIIFTVRPDGTVSSLSPAFEDIIGYPRNEWIGKHFSSLLHPDDIPLAMDIFRRIITGDAVPLFELRSRTQSGEYRYMEFRISPERFADGQVFGIARDITERRLAEDERARLVSAVEAAAESIVITSPSTGVIQYVNPAFEQMTGYKRREALGRTLHFLETGAQDKEFYIGLRDSLTRDGVWNGKLTNRRKDGTIYFEECTVSAVSNRDGKIINYVYLKRDVTEKMRLQSIAEAVNTMNNIGYVFSGISHELGNPVASLMVNLDLLKEKLDGTMADYVDRSLGELTKIDYLLNSLRSFNLFEVQDVKELPIVPFLEQFLSLVREDFARKGIDVAWDAGHEALIARADGRALQQILLNIFTNAADALEGRSRPAITMSVTHTGAGFLTIRVRDNGSGMTAEQQANLFKPFHTSKQHGTGLGMVIVKNMLSRMNGSIEVMSQEGEGTTVLITIPEGAHGDR
jgi:PAS domain S-box-containing protein